MKRRTNEHYDPLHTQGQSRTFNPEPPAVQKFSKCCGVPVYLTEYCSNCQLKCEVVEETSQEEKQDKMNIDLELTTIRNKRVNVFDFNPTNEPAKELPLADQPCGAMEIFFRLQGSETDRRSLVAYSVLCEWGKKYWKPVHTRKFLDEEGEEEYEEKWQSYQFLQVESEEDVAQINARRRREFIDKITEAILEDYLIGLMFVQ